MTWLTDPADEDWDEEDDAPRSHVKLIAAIVAGWLVVSLLVLAGLVLFKGTKSTDAKTTSKPAVASTSTASQSPAVALPDGWVRQAADDQTDCAAHAYGKVQQFFRSTPCTSVHRLLATSNQGGRPVVIAASTVTFPNATQAKQYLSLVTADGTGNINDLLREGAAVAGVGHQLPQAAFASKQVGSRVLVAEAAYTDGHSNNTDATLTALAQKAITT